ncbi:DUF6230 family protein [Kitasatospora aureofaciens]|uniref:Cholesterol esterase n=1 Tax=Kitasatospora aureofaciens TaxID=1894 RepID=A0A1E7N3U2_KITAU|nr:DUF6230 family protein [Kitasatospora aureofaciens]OEV35345.1 cholesterol esterase [Kitasatospora aureofaciens]QEV03006.1 cholesterol esterase [Streptomyces viridifaciens]UKZ09640.1 DUF6230 family protein [Streptomyces viridifaciens]GGU58298.1 hypothetical protein GCM10010502_06240 [Kitasatospora aureofaciens]
MAMSEDAAVAAETPTPTGTRRGRVRIKRTALMAVPAVAVGGILMTLTAQGVLAAQFSISGMPFTITADKLDGDGFAQFGSLDHMIPGSPNQGHTGGQVLVAVSAIKTAEITNLCQSVDLGGVNLVIHAGDQGTPVSASDLTTDSDLLSGDAEFKNIEIGGDASTYTKAGDVGKGGKGVFGQQADHVQLTHLNQHNYASTAVGFKLPNLRLSFSSKGC